MDIVFTVSVFTYLYKYLYKGPDHTLFNVSRTGQPSDEIKDYVDARYLSAHDTAWRILGFHITSKNPSVSCLPVHLLDENIARYTGRGTASDSTTSLLIQYFNRPPHVIFSSLKYCEYFELYVLYKWQGGDGVQDNEFLENTIHGCTRNKVSRQQATTKVSHLQMISPTAGELFYVRCLLTRQAARSFPQLQTVDGILHSSFHEAVLALGLFSDENEGHYALIDTVASFCTPGQIRFLFSRIVLEGFPATPLWNTFKFSLAQDFITSLRSEERGLDRALLSLQTSFQEGGRSLAQFGLPQPLLRTPEVVCEEERYRHRAPQLLRDADQSFLEMNTEQRNIFCTIPFILTLHNTLPTFLRSSLKESQAGGKHSSSMQSAIGYEGKITSSLLLDPARWPQHCMMEDELLTISSKFLSLRYTL